MNFCTINLLPRVYCTIKVCSKCILQSQWFTHLAVEASWLDCTYTLEVQRGFGSESLFERADESSLSANHRSGKNPTKLSWLPPSSQLKLCKVTWSEDTDVDLVVGLLVVSEWCEITCCEYWEDSEITEVCCCGPDISKPLRWAEDWRWEGIDCLCGFCCEISCLLPTILGSDVWLGRITSTLFSLTDVTSYRSHSVMVLVLLSWEATRTLLECSTADDASWVSISVLWCVNSESVVYSNILESK